MFDFLFPEANSPRVIAAIVGGRIVLNVVLALLVARAVGSTALLTAGVSVIIVLSGLLMMLVLRPNRFGVRTAHTELLAQVAVFILVGYAMIVNPSLTRVITSVIIAVCALGLLGIMLPVYGEATVAP